jgi:hypothetical protein
MVYFLLTASAGSRHESIPRVLGEYYKSVTRVKDLQTASAGSEHEGTTPTIVPEVDLR